MLFKPDPSKQAREMLYSKKATKTDHPRVIFNGNKVQSSANQKHLGLVLDEKLTFNDHIAFKLTTVNKLTITLRKIYHYITKELSCHNLQSSFCGCYISQTQQWNLF